MTGEAVFVGMILFIPSLAPYRAKIYGGIIIFQLAFYIGTGRFMSVNMGSPREDIQ